MMLSLSFAALFVSCSTSVTDDGFSEPSRVSQKEAHDIVQLAIQTCMNDQGFEYRKIPFVESRYTSLEDAVYLTGSEVWGYGATLSFVTASLVPNGSPSSDMSIEKVAAYDEALVGHHGDHAHHPEDAIDDSHTHSSSVEGCLARGHATEEGLIVDNSTLWLLRQPAVEAEVYERLLSSEDYPDFRSGWSSCMDDEGVSASDPFAYQQKWFAEYRAQLGEISGGGDSTVQELLLASLDGDLPDYLPTQWFHGRIGAVQQLEAILDEEAAAARTDSSCRTKNRGSIDATIDAIVLDLQER